jgi:hypothetical protein
MGASKSNGESEIILVLTSFNKHECTVTLYSTDKTACRDPEDRTQKIDNAVLIKELVP